MDADRVTCRLLQRIAPYAGMRPDETAFSRVMLNDISTTGCSFVGKNAPETPEFVIALDIGPIPCLMLARVVNQYQCGGGMLVDCEFTGKLAG